ncbi:MAG: 3-dehydroquinate synthase, partial [Chloroflexota bacterium]
GAYPVLVGQGAMVEAPRLLREMGAGRAVLVTDDHVAPLWGESFAQGLTGAGIHTDTVTLPAGESAKTFGQLQLLLGAMERHRLDRGGFVVAVGGGTVGDVAGFAAAIWLRGVRLLQVPTTLLAMVDAAIGGKTGINTDLAKNAVGAFWQPVAVVADLATLGTLPEDEYLAAYGEIVKYAITLDPKLALILVADAERLLARDPEALETVVDACVAAKAKVVAADERDQGPRAVLNYGHTVGHALETATGYRLAHGRAVAHGMRAAARIAARTGRCSEGLVAQQDELLAAYGLPGPLPRLKVEDVLAAIPRDKKAAGGSVGWVLPRELGRAEVGRRVPSELVEEVVRELVAI